MGYDGGEESKDLQSRTIKDRDQLRAPADFPPLSSLHGGAPVFYSPDGKVCPL